MSYSVTGVPLFEEESAFTAHGIVQMHGGKNMQYSYRSLIHYNYRSIK